MLAKLLLLADGRLPVGGHVHSGGIEAAIRDGRIGDLDDLRDFAVGRLHSVGLTEAALVAAGTYRLTDDNRAEPVVAELDRESEARQPVDALRESSRRLGRQLIRVVSRWEPHRAVVAAARVSPNGPHQAVALAACAAAANLTPLDAATLALHHQAALPVQAAVKLVGLDPFGAAELLADLTSDIGALATRAAASAPLPLIELPALSTPLLDIDASVHALVPDRLFAT